MGNLKAIIAFILLIISAGFANAYIELFDEWVESDENFRLGDFRLEPTWTEHTMIMKIDDNKISIPEGECKKSLPFDICYNESRSVKDGNIVPDNINDQSIDHEMRIIVYGIVAELVLSREFENTTIIINKEIDVDVKIENTGNADATEVMYEEEYPEEFIVKNIAGCKNEGNSITWSGNLRKGAKQACSYTLKAVEETAYNSKATLDYFNGVDDEQTSHTAKLTIPPPVLTIEMEASDTKIAPGETVSINFNFTNTKSNTLAVNSLSLEIPPNFEVTDEGIFKSLSWKGQITNYLSTSISLRAVRTGECLAGINADYGTKDSRQAISPRIKFKITNDLDIEIIDNAADITSEKTNILAVTLKNQGEKPLYNIKTKTASGISDFEGLTAAKDELGKKNTFIILEKSMGDVSKGKYNLTITTTYENEFSETFEKVIQREIIIDRSREVKEDTKEDENSLSSGSEQNTPENSSAAQEDKKSVIPGIHLNKDDKAKIGGFWIVAVVIIAALLLIYLKYKISS